MAIDDLNIYTRLCEILNIYIWGEKDMGRDGEGRDLLKSVYEIKPQKKRDTIKISLS